MRPVRVRKVKPEILTYLLGLHEWVSRGRPECDFAAEQGITSSASTQRKFAAGLYAERAVGLLDMASGRPLPELLAAGEIVEAPAAEEKVPA